MTEFELSEEDAYVSSYFIDCSSCELKGDGQQGYHSVEAATGRNQSKVLIGPCSEGLGAHRGLELGDASEEVREDASHVPWSHGPVGEHLHPQVEVHRCSELRVQV
jgi:hypothetical protein